jgi:murein peptide amidase A
MPVKASPLDPTALLARFETAAVARGFRAERFGTIDGCPLLAFTRRTPGVRPRIYLSSGIHGDEPAPPQALLALLERGAFDDRATWFLMPMLNPAGYRQGTRDTPAGVDPNRDYRARRTPEVAAHVRWLERQPRFNVALCLHEDWEATGFYLYELNPDNQPSLAPTMIAAAATKGLIEPALIIDGRPVHQPGIICPEPDPQLRDQWPEALYLEAFHTRHTYTLETPSGVTLEQRVGTLVHAVEAGLDQFCGGRRGK